MSDVILTSEHLDAWVQEMDRQQAVMAKAQEKIDELQAKLDLVASLTGKKHKGSGVVKSRAPRDGDASLSAQLTKIIDSHVGESISHTQIQAEATAAGFGDALERNPTYYYNLISKLVKKGALIKSGRSHFTVPAKAEETHAEAATMAAA